MAPRKKPEPDARQGDLFASLPTPSPAVQAPPAPQPLRETPGHDVAPLQTLQPAPVTPHTESDAAATDLRREALQVNRNAAFMAGAGAGKTYSLISMCLHALSGARADDRPVAPRELWLLTFSDKAAGEMRERLRERLDALAETDPEEADLRHAFAELQRPFPSHEVWSGIREQLGAATIKTFHAACMQILNDAPAAEPVELLPDREARELMRTLATAVVLEAIEAHSAGMTALLKQTSLERVVSSLCETLGDIREEGLSAATVSVGSVAEAHQAFSVALQQVRALVREAIPQVKQFNRAKLVTIQPILERLTLATFKAEWSALAEGLSGAKKTDPLMHEILGIHLRPEGDSDEHGLLAAYLSWEMAPREQAVHAALIELERRYNTELELRRALDFTGQLIRCRDVLRDDLSYRQTLQRRIRLLLTDEFQDTNRLQMEILCLLAEERSGAPRTFSHSLDSRSEEIAQTPLQPGLLAIVGDLKQAIYDFRGADVGVFRQMADRVVAEGGLRVPLTHSRRSSKRLVAALNSLMSGALRRDKFSPGSGAVGGLAPYQVAFEAADALTAFREEVPEGAPVIQLTVEQPVVNKRPTLDPGAEAEAVAKYLAHVFKAGSLTVIDRNTKAERPVKPGDVALLFRTTRNLNRFRQALLNHDIRHRLSMKRGFSSASEVADLASLLNVIADPSDLLSLHVVLRSPLVALTDDALLQLAQGGQLESLQALKIESLAVSPPEAQSLAQLRTVILQLRGLADRLSVGEVLRFCLQHLAVRERYAGLPFGEQALGNIKRLVELADAAQRESLAEFTGRLLADVDAEIDDKAEADVTAGDASELVTLSTVHAAKGLEWPVVVLPCLHQIGASASQLIRFERSVGLAISATVDPLPEKARSRRAEMLRRVQTQRAHAESLRLLYVAATRARDRLILGPLWTRTNSWSAVIQDAQSFSAMTHHDDLQPVDTDALPRERAPAEVVPTAPDTVFERLHQLETRPVPLPRQVMLPVTQLQEFDNCPRRYLFSTQLGLAETPVDIDWTDHDELPSQGDARERGVMAHRLLELTPLSATRGAPLAAALKRIRERENLKDDAEVDRWVTSFWQSPFGQRVAAAGPSVQREASFVLSLKSRQPVTLLLRGQIDLLFADGAEAFLIDYKTTHSTAAGLEPYAFQLSSYALAAHRLLPPGVQLKAGISFLKDADPTPHFLPTLTDEAALSEHLTSLATNLMRSQAAHDWPGRSIEKCRALHCGYISRCHPSAAAV